MANGGPATAGKFDDVHYPAYSMGAAAELLGVTPGFLRDLGEAGLVTPHRSSGGHRRYSRHQLALAARLRELLDAGHSLASAEAIVGLQDELASARADADRLRSTATRLRSDVNRLRRDVPSADEPQTP